MTGHASSVVLSSAGNGCTNVSSSEYTGSEANKSSHGSKATRNLGVSTLLHRPPHLVAVRFSGRTIEHLFR